MLVSVWQLAGYMILIYVAGFMGLSEDVLEAASIDGASGWVKMKKHYPSADDVLRYYLPLPDPVPCVHGIRCQPVLNRRCSVPEPPRWQPCTYMRKHSSRQFGVGQAKPLSCLSL